MSTVKELLKIMNALEAVDADSLSDDVNNDLTDAYLLVKSALLHAEAESA